MYANYMPVNHLRVLALSAQGIDCASRFCQDLVMTPAEYYRSPSTAYIPKSLDEFLRVKMTSDQNITIYNDFECDWRLKAALAHRIAMRQVSSLIDESDRKYLSVIFNAIIRGDLDMLTQVFGALYTTNPKALTAYVKTVSDGLVRSGAGVCLTIQFDRIILLHAYHGKVAIAIDPNSMTHVLVPIRTEWDGSVFAIEGEVTDSTSEKLTEELSNQSIRRILLQHEQEESADDAFDLPALFNKAA